MTKILKSISLQGRKQESEEVEALISSIQQHVQILQDYQKTVDEKEKNVKLLLGKLADLTSYTKVEKLFGINKGSVYQYKETYYEYLKETDQEHLRNTKKKKNTALIDYLKKNNRIKDENIKYYE